ncbi:carbon-nitrogen hydrolase [Hypoxylon sp. EC38]|nr:carbon-nitrogen hydrolase [Hypoxylon sp. EC38]
MKIACLQFAPQVGDVDNNLNRADAILNKANPQDLDLLVLPELAVTGYNFRSLRDISPFLEPTGAGISSVWARTTALKYNCTTIVGYPEKMDVSGRWPTSPEYYNSALIVNQDGDTIGHYRKTHLYYTDETWALEGPGFFKGRLPGINGNVAMGISPWHAFEFAFHVLESNANVVILSMAWLTTEDFGVYSSKSSEPDLDTLTYWLTRLEPLIRAETEEEIIVIFANRTGVEDNAVYAGTSAVIGIQGGEVNVYGVLSRGAKELLVVDTEAAPYAKLRTSGTK